MQDSGISLKAECGACAALCCVMLPFDGGADFGFDKAAREPCRHLAGHACGIHDRLEAAGFQGCRRYDCLGAGQRVVQEVFGGRSWQKEPALLAPMEAAFRAMRRLHEDHALLTSAASLPLTGEEAAERLRLLAALDLAAPQTAEGLQDFEAGPLPGAVRGFLASLRARLRPRR